MGAEKQVKTERGTDGKTPRINFRFFLFCALGLIAGISLYCAVRLHRFTFYTFVPFVLLFIFALRPFGWKRIAAIMITVFLCLGAGVGLTHLACERYRSGVPEGDYEVTGTVETIAFGNNFQVYTFKNLSFNGVSSGGKMTAYGSDDLLRPGDVVTFSASVLRKDLPRGNQNSYAFAKDIRYETTFGEYEKKGEKGALLILNAKIYDLFQSVMTRDEASVAYALLTGNSSFLDEELADTVRQGGIAHVFAVSGLHIGIVYAAVLLVCRPLKRFAPLPALAAAVCYAALCAFTVSSVRALIMCAALSAYRATGRKSDLLTSLSVAALCILSAAPAQYLSAGFTLSFAAVLGLALFSHTLFALFRKLKFPVFLANYLGASLAVQLITFPLLMQLFGYASLWALLLNFILLPCLPVLLLCLILCTLFALITTWTGIMAIPVGLISLFLLILSVIDVSWVISGFALGAGGAVIITSCVLLTQRVRMKPLVKTIAAVYACCLFAFAVAAENVVLTGCRLTAYSTTSGDLVLVRTPHATALVLDGDISLRACNDFLNRHYGGTLDAVICLSDAELDAINVAAFLNAEAVYAKEKIPTGFQEIEVLFCDEISVGDITLRYEKRDKAVLFVQDIAVEIDFENPPVFACDLFLGKGGSSEYILKNGMIKIR